MHSDILHYTKLAFNSLKMIQNDTVYQPIKQEMIGPLTGVPLTSPDRYVHVDIISVILSFGYQFMCVNVCD